LERKEGDRHIGTKKSGKHIGTKKGDRHWNKGRRQTLEQRKVENILGRSGKIGASETSAKKRKKTLTRL